MSQMTQILKMPKLNCWPKKSRKFLQALHDLNHVDLQYGDHDDHDYCDLDWGDPGDHVRSVYTIDSIVIFDSYSII